MSASQTSLIEYSNHQFYGLTMEDVNVKINYPPLARQSYHHKLQPQSATSDPPRHQRTMCETLKISTKELLTFIVHALIPTKDAVIIGSSRAIVHLMLVGVQLK